MSGHNKWSTIKHKKSKEDAKRGKLFSKAIKEITIAAREGGGNPEMNPRLRNAIEYAKSINMPSDNIERAIKKGTGELEGETIEEIHYEGYGPGGVAILVETATDNKNRTTSEIRHIFSKYNGKMGSVGSVTWMFDRKGIIITDSDNANEIIEIAIENGADDVKETEEGVEIYTGDQEFANVKKALEEKNIKIKNAEITKLPQNTVKLDEEKARSLLKLLDKLEECDDVQNVYSNFEIDDDILEKLAQ